MINYMGYLFTLLVVIVIIAYAVKLLGMVFG
jgi:hypothetical protein